jgi:hypothetical protein
MNSYPTVFNLGHKAIQDIFSGPVVVQEKVDGSQISFGVIDGTLRIRSKRAEIDPERPDAMFDRAVANIKLRADLLVPGWVYRGEYLRQEKHNVLRYQSIPRGHIALFDVQTGIESYQPPEGVAAEAVRLDLGFVPTYHVGPITPDQLPAFLERESFLGGTKIEGIVVKNYNVFTPEKKIAIAKLVSEDFREVHRKEWKVPSQGDFVEGLAERYRTHARWRKAVQHLAETGEIEGSMRDIPRLLKEVNADVLRECEDEIKEALFKHFWPRIAKLITRGLPEWYREQVEVIHVA